MKIKKFFLTLIRPILLWSDRNELYHGWPMAFFLIAYCIIFHIIEVIPRSHYLTIVMPIDRVIPFCELFVVPYLSWFVFVTIGIIKCYRLDRDAYDELCTSLMIGMGLFLVISAFLPNRQPLRLLEMPRDNVFTWLVTQLWKMDTPTNVWPSIHVFNTAAVEMAILKSGHPTFRKLSFRIGLSIWSLLIILSTVFIKQHSMFDMITAFILIAICYIRIYREHAVWRFAKWDAFALRIEKEAREAEQLRLKRLRKLRKQKRRKKKKWA